MCSGNGQRNPQPIYLSAPRWTAQYHQVLPSPGFISSFTSIYDLAYNLLQEAQFPGFLLHLHFSILCEITTVSGVCHCIASEKLVTLKSCHLFLFLCNSGYKKKFTKLLLFFSFPYLCVLGDHIR